MTDAATEQDSNGRTRFSVKPYYHLLKDSDNEDEEITDSDESSEDEWTSKEKKRKKSTVCGNTPQIRTLKKKLAEKTKALRRTVNKSSKTPEQVDSSESANKNIKSESPASEPVDAESTNQIKAEKTDAKVKLEASAINTNSLESLADVKIKPTAMVSVVETPKKPEPVVLTYSTIKNSVNISPILLNNDSSLPSKPSTPTRVSSNTAPPVSLPTTPAATPVSPSCSNVSPSVPRIRVRSNLQTTPGVRVPSTVPSRSTLPTIPNSPRPRMRASMPRTPQRACAPRTPQFSSHRSTASSISPSPCRSRNTYPNSIPVGHSRTLGGESTVTSPANVRTSAPLKTQITPTLKDSKTLKNISSSGTVIISGSNSVTITPRKVVPEKPPVQRKLFRNEIEGIIAVRHENGVMKYVLNLANGTHMPLTDLQVTKLREQNGGRLPPKLKIPVPSDVAAKIEPSYLIED